MQGTLHLGARNPKAYDKDSDPANPVLSEEQPGEVKCRMKFRTSKDSTIEQTMSELRRCWQISVFDAAPAWVAGTNDALVQLVSEMFGGIDIRPWEPEEGDD